MYNDNLGTRFVLYPAFYSPTHISLKQYSVRDGELVGVDLTLKYTTRFPLHSRCPLNQPPPCFQSYIEFYQHRWKMMRVYGEEMHHPISRFAGIPDLLRYVDYPHDERALLDMNTKFNTPLNVTKLQLLPSLPTTLSPSADESWRQIAIPSCRGTSHADIILYNNSTVVTSIPDIACSLFPQFGKRKRIIVKEYDDQVSHAVWSRYSQHYGGLLYLMCHWKARHLDQDWNKFWIDLRFAILYDYEAIGS